MGGIDVLLALGVGGWMCGCVLHWLALVGGWIAHSIDCVFVRFGYLLHALRRTELRKYCISLPFALVVNLFLMILELPFFTTPLAR